MTGPERSERDPPLGEWTCLGILYDGPAHGWAIAKRLRPAGDIGRIWQLSRPLTYRALDHLTARGWIEQVAEEPGDAGPTRTVLAATRAGRSRFRYWLRTPVPHLRDLRSELLLKLVFAERHHVDISDMLVRQRTNIEEQAAHLTDVDDGEHDVVILWRIEATRAAQRFLDQVHPATATPRQPVTAWPATSRGSGEHQRRRDRPRRRS
jgi:DNA-binding PadR family transcriptional regulator